MQSIENIITRFPRHDIVTDPTPLIRLNRLSDALGVDLWMKRDDVAGPSFGGNKSRQLEYYFGAAVAQQADTILITGAVQSNFVRLAAAVAAGLGMKAIVQLETRVAKSDLDYTQSGNVLLNSLLGAQLLSYPDGEDEQGADAALYDAAERLRSQGQRPYVIPLGSSSAPLGSLGYMKCAAELMQQTDQPFDVVFVGSGSGATHLGLAAGLKLLSPATRVIGCCVRRNAERQHHRLCAMAKRFSEMVKVPELLAPTDFHVWDQALAPGYGKLGAQAAEAIELMAQNEGHILDPVYTAKVFAGLISKIRHGELKPGSRLLFVHTGGLAATFAYRPDLSEWLDLAPFE